MTDTITAMPKSTKPKAAKPAPAKAAPKPSDTIRVETDIAKKVTIIAIRRGISVSDFISPLLRPIVEKAYADTVRMMSKELDG